MLIVAYILLGLLGVLAVALLLPISARLEYETELTVCVRVCGVLVYRFYSSNPRPQKADKPPTASEDKLHRLSERLKTDGVGTVLAELSALADTAKRFTRYVLRAVTVDRLALQLIIASEDASSTAQNTGRVCALLYPALTTLQAVLRIRRRAVTVVPDYLAQQGRVRADVRAHVIPVRLLPAALCAVRAYISRQRKNTKEDLSDGQ